MRDSSGQGSTGQGAARSSTPRLTSPRIPPLPPDQWGPGMRDALAALLPTDARHPLPPRGEGRSKGLNVLGTLAQHPTLTTAYHTFNGYILFGSTLDPRDRELLVLRVSILRDAPYEWAQHVIQGLDAGLTREEIERIRVGPTAEGWLPIERTMLQAVDELVDDAMVTDETWKALAEHFGTEELMDLVFTVGCYELLAMAFNSFGLQLDDDLRP
ncbi:MAG TPA: carboxymuconolactone decarboxylase family protein [Acidimicrobiales bacterium]